MEQEIIVKKGEQPQTVIIKDNSLGGVIIMINNKKLTLEEAEKLSGAKEGCLMEAIRESSQLRINDYLALIDYLS